MILSKIQPECGGCLNTSDASINHHALCASGARVCAGARVETPAPPRHRGIQESGMIIIYTEQRDMFKLRMPRCHASLPCLAYLSRGIPAGRSEAMTERQPHRRRSWPTSRRDSAIPPPGPSRSRQRHRTHTIAVRSARMRQAPKGGQSGNRPPNDGAQAAQANPNAADPPQTAGAAAAPLRRRPDQLAASAASNSRKIGISTKCRVMCA
jgi:hypothetical protein